MYIHGQFYDMDNNLCEVRIVTNNDTTQELVIGESEGLFFGANPVKITTSIDNTMSPVITKACKISLVTESYLGDILWASNARNIKVNVLKGGNIIFAGFVEPTTYSQPYVNKCDHFELNCKDCLSTLNYYKYMGANAANFAAKILLAETVSFKAILDKVMEDMLDIDIIGGADSKILYDLSKGKDSESAATLFNDYGISEAYLLGEDIDDCMTCEDVLSEMMRYLNLHIIQEGVNYYIFDWNTIKNGRTDWIDILTDTTESYTPNMTAITSSLHSDANTQVSLAEVYNQVQVTDNYEDQGDVIVSPLDDGTLYSNFSGKQLYCREYYAYGDGNTAANSINDMLSGNVTTYDKAKEVLWYIRVMSNANWQFYSDDGNTTLEEAGIIETENGSYVNQYSLPKYMWSHTCTPAILQLGKVERQADAADNSPVASIDMKNYLYISVNGNEVDTEGSQFPSDNDLLSHEGMIKYVGAKSGGVYSPVDADTTNYFVFTGKLILQPIIYESSETSQLSRLGTYSAVKGGHVKRTEHGGHSNTVHMKDEHGYYVRKFYEIPHPTQRYDAEADIPYCASGCMAAPWSEYHKYIDEFVFRYSSVGSSSDTYSKLPVLECEMKIGDKYCVETTLDDPSTAVDETTYEWLTMEEIQARPDLTYVDDGVTKYKTTFTLGINPKIGDVILGEEYDLQNNIDYTMGLDVEGTAIPIKMSDALSGKLSFRILGPVNLLWNNITRRHPTFFRHTAWSEGWKFILSHVENIIIEDFQCKVYTNGSGATTGDADICYVSDENHEYMDTKEVDFKFVTQLTTAEFVEMGASATIAANAVVDMTTGLASNNIYNVTTLENGKAEEHYVDQYYTEYSKPRVLMSFGAHNTSRIDFRDRFSDSHINKQFYVQQIDEDVKKNTINLTLKEYD